MTPYPTITILVAQYLSREL